MSTFFRTPAAMLIVVISVLTSFVHRGAYGAVVECVYRPTMCEFALLRGTIVKGDYEKVAALYGDNRKLLELLLPAITRRRCRRGNQDWAAVSPIFSPCVGT